MPKMPKPQKETFTIKLKAVFASLDGKDSDDDGARFEKELRELIRKFKPKSEFKPDIKTEKVSYGKSGTI
jgi:hypothetical protein